MRYIACLSRIYLACTCTYRHWALGLRGTNTVASNQAYEAKAAGYFILRIRGEGGGGGGINSGHADGVGVCSKFPIIMRYNIIFGIYGIHIQLNQSFLQIIDRGC